MPTAYSYRPGLSKEQVRQVVEDLLAQVPERPGTTLELETTREDKKQGDERPYQDLPLLSIKLTLSTPPSTITYKPIDV